MNVSWKQYSVIFLDGNYNSFTGTDEIEIDDFTQMIVILLNKKKENCILETMVS